MLVLFFFCLCVYLFCFVCVSFFVLSDSFLLQFGLLVEDGRSIQRPSFAFKELLIGSMKNTPTKKTAKVKRLTVTGQRQSKITLHTHDKQYYTHKRASSKRSNMFWVYKPHNYDPTQDWFMKNPDTTQTKHVHIFS